MPCDTRFTNAPFDLTSDVAIANPVSFTAESVVSRDDSTLTPPTTTVSLRVTLVVTKRSSGSVNVTTDWPAFTPTNVLVRAFAASEDASPSVAELEVAQLN